MAQMLCIFFQPVPEISVVRQKPFEVLHHDSVGAHNWFINGDLPVNNETATEVLEIPEKKLAISANKHKG
jgi:hypothetical protein